MLRPTAIWKFNGTSYTDLTDNVKTNSSFDFIAASTDYIYIGLDRRYVGIFLDLLTNGNYSGLNYGCIVSGEIWGKLNLIDTYAFDTSKYCRWVLPEDWIKFNFTSTIPHSAIPPDTMERYWIRISCSTVTTKAVISKIKCIPFATYTNPTKVSELLQLKKDFDNSTKPTDLTVEEMVRRAEDYIDYRTRKSWRFNAVTEETDPQLVDYNRYGFYLRHRNFMKVYSVQLWNGNSWQTLTEGRNNDYFMNYDLGMCYLTRLFLLPAAYGMTGRYFHYGFGEFKNSVKVDYIYGRNLETDREFYIVEDIATKIVAKDILKHHDYSSLVVSGTDKVSLESKVRLLEEEVEMRLDSLTAIAVY